MLPALYQFEGFQLDVARYELRRNGRVLKLEKIPMELLILLISKQGVLVSRQEIVEKLWGQDVFIETEHGINTAVRKIRQILGDDSERPRFVQTVVGKGYRFVAAVSTGATATSPSNGAQSKRGCGNGAPSADDGATREELPLEAIPNGVGTATLVPDSGYRAILPGTLPKRGDRFIRVVEQPSPRWTMEGLEDSSHTPARGKFPPWIIATSVGGVVVILAFVALGIYTWKSHQQALNLEEMHIVRFTDSGKAEDVAISPSGEYIAYVLREGEQRRLSVRQVATGSEVQILPPDVVELRSLTFSPDGNYIFFLRTPKENFLFDSLFRMPLFGGTPQKLTYDIDTPISFSPDGKQFTFVRITNGITHLVVANADGTGERVLASHPGESFDYPAWSPDGKTIAFPGPGSRGEGHVWAVSLVDARVHSVFKTRSAIGRIHWLPEGNGLLAVMRDPAQQRGQLWYISYPSGEAKRVTNDLADYALGQLDLTRDGKSLVAVESTISSDLWVVHGGGANRAQQITSGRAGVRWIAAGAEQTIIFANEKGDLYSIHEDGSSLRLLTPNMHRNANPSVCRDGRHIVFESAVGGQTLSLAGRASDIWKMEADGSHLVPLTETGNAVAPLCSADSESVQYFDIDLRKNWRIPVAGGTPIQVDTQNRWMVARSYSPDGKLIAYNDPGMGDVPNQIVILPAIGGEEIYTFRFPQGNTSFVRWTLDGTGLEYFLTNKGVGNIWRQPVPKGAPKQVTNFTWGQIFSFDWSRDAKQLYVARGSVSSDIVLITKFR